MKIGFLSLPVMGHLNPMTVLARKLQSRGHEVMFIGVPDVEPVVRGADLDFVSFCENEYPPVAQGVPMVAIPMGYDQPGVAARIAYHRVGEFVEIGDLTARRQAELIAKVKGNPNYRDKARWFQKVLANTRGLDAAADIIEGVFAKHLEEKRQQALAYP